MFIGVVSYYMNIAVGDIDIFSVVENMNVSSVTVQFEVIFNIAQMEYDDLSSSYDGITSNFQFVVDEDLFGSRLRSLGSQLGFTDCTVDSVLFSAVFAEVISYAPTSAPVVGPYNIYRVAGNGSSSSSGDGGNARSAGLAYPISLWQSTSGTTYVVESTGNCVRQISDTSIINVFAGSCNSGANYGGDGGAASSSLLDNPSAVVGDTNGYVYIVDYGNQIVRSVSSGVIQKFAGVGGVATLDSEGIPATSATFHFPYGLWIDSNGNMYVSEQSGGYCVRKIDTSNLVFLFAGIYFHLIKKFVSVSQVTVFKATVETLVPLPALVCRNRHVLQVYSLVCFTLLTKVLR